MPPVKGGKRPAVGGKSSGKGKKKTLSGKGAPRKGGSKAGGKGKGKGKGKGGKIVGGKGRRGGKRAQKWSGYVHKVLHTVHKPLTISSHAMSVVSSFVEDMFEKIQQEAVHVAKVNKTKTLTAREVQTSARLLLPGELAKHAMSEGTKAVAKYNSVKDQMPQTFEA